MYQYCRDAEFAVFPVTVRYHFKTTPDTIMRLHWRIAPRGRDSGFLVINFTAMIPKGTYSERERQMRQGVGPVMLTRPEQSRPRPNTIKAKAMAIPMQRLAMKDEVMKSCFFSSTLTKVQAQFNSISHH